MKVVFFPNGITGWRVVRWIVFAIVFFLMGTCYMYGRVTGMIPGFR